MPEGHFNHSHFNRSLKAFRAFIFLRCVVSSWFYCWSPVKEAPPRFLTRQVTRFMLLLIPSIFYPYFLDFLLSVSQREWTLRMPYRRITAQKRRLFVSYHNSGLWLSPLTFFVYTARLYSKLFAHISPFSRNVHLQNCFLTCTHIWSHYFIFVSFKVESQYGKNIIKF